MRLARPLCLVVVFLTVVSMACGGGGGGGGGPTQPPPPTPPPTQVTGNVRVTVAGFENADANYSGSSVEMVGVGTTTVDSDNTFAFNDVPVGVQQLRITGNNHLTRRVRIRVNEGTNRFTLDLVESAGFDLAAFDEIWRSFSIPGTIRWKKRPTRVLLDRSLGTLPQGMNFFETEVKQAYANWLPRYTFDFFKGTPVQKGSIDPLDPDAFDCADVEDGDVVIVGIDECPMDEEFIILGSTTHCFTTNGNEVLLAAIFFNPCTTEATIEHEIIHSLCAGHLESRPNDSIMGSPGGAGEILPVDRRHMRYVYGRPAGVESPDDSSALAVLEPGAG